MQRLIRILDELRRTTPHAAVPSRIHIVREYLQVLMLKAIAQSKYGHGLSFMGGTCLRICYGLKRYSEDLDFALDRRKASYSFRSLVQQIQGDLEKRGFMIEATVDEEEVVQKSFIKFTGLLFPLGLSHRKGHKLQIKLEIDTRPIPISDAQRESHFVTKFGEIFPIMKHTDAALFAGKIMAILCRSYAKGRDYYDLIWFLTRKTRIDLDYLMSGLKRGRPFASSDEVMDELRLAVHEAEASAILHDIGRFLEDPTEEAWIRNYGALFDQLAGEYLKLMRET